MHGDCAARAPRLLAAALAASSAIAFAQTEGFARLPEVIVTAPSGDGSLRTVPHGVSVITADDILKSTATTVVDLLAQEPNLNLQSYYGTEKNSTIDMRGMGDTAGSNVLILVDGVRLNEVDLSGADLSSVPLSQVERIEIIRGGGAVQYGNGAVAGVINIITRRGVPGRNSLDLEVARGSYGLRDTRLQARGSTGPLAVSLNLSERDTDGFRTNGYLHSRNASGEVRLVAPWGLDFLDAFIRVAHHKDRNGLPGPVSAANFAASTATRRGTTTPFDHGETDDVVYTTGVFADLNSAGRIELQTSFRNRENPYVIGYTPLLPLADQLSTITSKRHDVQLRYDNDLQLFGMKQSFSAGMNAQQGDYARYSNGRLIPDQSQQKLGTVHNNGAFVAATLRPTSQWAFNAGLRSDRFSTTLSDQKYTNTCTYTNIFLPFSKVPIPVLVGCTPYAYAVTNQRQGTWRNRASELGLTWTPNSAWTVFASASHHFRNPNIDELVLAAADLRPQTGHTLETGARWSPGKKLELSATLFDIRIQDEIYYGADPASGLSANRNYDQPTRRTGGELEARWQATQTLALRAGVGHVVPRFVGTRADVPLVPRSTASLQAEWKLNDRVSWSTAARFVGARFDGNDFGNTLYPRLPSYTVVDMAWRVAATQAIELSVGVNNLFDRAYSARAYSRTYYPMPERNFYVRMRVGL